MSSNLDTEIVRHDAKQTKRIGDHNKTIFVIRLRAAPDRDPYRELKALLKVALRRHGFRAIDLREEAAERPGTAA
jgi:hypothetical protein